MKNWRWEDRLELEFLLRSQYCTRKYLNLTFSERDWFGNQLPLIKELLGNLHFVEHLPRKPKKQERIRGYRDHGTLKPPHRWLERFDWSFNLQHVVEESRRKLFLSLLDYLESTTIRVKDPPQKNPVRGLIEEIYEEFKKQDFRSY
jgi:hypothetical protein